MNINRIRDDTVRLDIDVSRDYHKFILGIGRQMIDAIMRETGCYIKTSNPNYHSPENPITDSISIYGILRGVEEARRIIRISCPNILRFDLPRMSTEDLGQLISYLELVKDIYNVQADIIEENVPEVVVVGNRGDNSAIDAINLLLRYIFKAKSCVTFIRTNMSISPLLHRRVLGLDEIHIESIEVNSHVQINVINDIFTIEGRASDVVVAQEQLTGCLPVALTFKVWNSTNYCNNGVTNANGVLIEVLNIYNDDSVRIEGLERNIDAVYNTYSGICQMNETEAVIPSTYHFKLLSVDELADIRVQQELKRTQPLDISSSSESDTDSCDGDDLFYAADSNNLNEDYVDTSDLDPNALPQNEWTKNLLQCVNDSEGQFFPRESRLRLYSSTGSSASSQNSPEASNAESNASSNNDEHIDYHNDMLSDDHSIDTEDISMENRDRNNNNYNLRSLEPFGVD